LLQDNNSNINIPLLPDINQFGTSIRQQYLGIWDDKHCYSVEIEPFEQLPGNVKWMGLRQAYGLLPDVFFSLAGEAIQIMDWDRTHQFCGRCGTRTEYSGHEFSKKCPACGLTAYPRISPAVIVLIQHTSRICRTRRKP
jgi:NAD+ diphosphatase